LLGVAVDECVERKLGLFQTHGVVKDRRRGYHETGIIVKVHTVIEQFMKR
jgi:hypothetical protein